MIYIMLTAMRPLVIQHDPVSRLGPIGERFADHGCDVTRFGVDAQNFITPTFPTSMRSSRMGAARVYDHVQIGRCCCPDRAAAPSRCGRRPVLGICSGWAAAGDRTQRQRVVEVTRVRSNFVNGIKKFPVRVHPLTPEVEH